MRILIVGAGGHGQVVADILLRMKDRGGQSFPVGFLDDAEALHGNHLLGLRVFGEVARRKAIAYDALIIAIGDNLVRQRWYRELSDQGEKFTNAHHPGAILAPDVGVGLGSMISAGVIVNTGARVGYNVILNTGCSIDHHCQIGNHAHVAPGARLGGNVVIAEGALIGMGAIVLPGCSVGAWSRVSAGAVVNHDVPEGVTAVGAPARVITKHSRSGSK